eukprot:scaffold32723_cov22-Tisochrysis_lutea.AAC.1
MSQLLRAGNRDYDDEGHAWGLCMCAHMRHAGSVSWIVCQIASVAGTRAVQQSMPGVCNAGEHPRALRC